MRSDGPAWKKIAKGWLGWKAEKIYIFEGKEKMRLRDICGVYSTRSEKVKMGQGQLVILQHHYREEITVQTIPGTSFFGFFGFFIECATKYRTLSCTHTEMRDARMKLQCE